MRRTVVLLLEALLTGLLFGASGLAIGLSAADAHASLVASSPTDGQVVGGVLSHIDLIFDEPIMVPDVEVVGPDGQVMEVRIVQPVPNQLRVEMLSAVTMNGRYQVMVKLISADEDPLLVKLAFEYELGAEPALPVVGSVVVERSNTGWVRWVLLLGGSLVVSVLAARLVRSGWLLRQTTQRRS